MADAEAGGCLIGGAFVEAELMQVVTPQSVSLGIPHC